VIRIVEAQQVERKISNSTSHELSRLLPRIDVIVVEKRIDHRLDFEKFDSRALQV
jgi:hypothetical protein